MEIRTKGKYLLIYWATDGAEIVNIDLGAYDLSRRDDRERLMQAIVSEIASEPPPGGWRS